MKVIIDDKIPYIKGALEPFAEVVYLPGSKTTPEVVKDADALITRTRTICNERLLAGSSVKFIATATIGYDHIDTDYCKRAGIAWTNAPGCNAGSVEQYIASALHTWALEKREKLREKTIGIIGVGNVGSKVARFCETLGMKVLLNDPPRERAEGPEKFVPLDAILREADIITFHVPLNLDGTDATWHMAGPDFFRKLAKKPLVINSCRGEVLDTPAVKDALINGRIAGFIADCWENEPDIDLELLNMAYLATPHIAGYSKDGKANGTRMSVQALSRFFNLDLIDWQPKEIELPDTTEIFMDGSRRDEESVIAEAVLSTYDIESDSDRLKSSPEKFEKFRGDYPVRREFPVYTIHAKNVDKSTIHKLKTIGFRVIELP
ncbi:MAG: 4-phosphoerythronate dehydrogenase PdxB [Bacteroidota bacterium]